MFRNLSLTLALLLTGSLVALTFAQDAEPGSADDVADEMMGEMGSASEAQVDTDSELEVMDEAEPEPTAAPQPQPVPAEVANPMGVAPDLQPTDLRREGEFVVNRRGRLLRVANAPFPVFAFNADTRTAPEPPMTVMPCQLLEEMQNTIANDSSAVFILTGQVFTYQGRNYLLPTMARQARPNEL